MILFVGRLVKVKGLQYLIEAMRDCPAEQLLIVGDGPERAALHQAATGMSNVSFAGGVTPNRVDAYLSRAKVLVVPSVNEGLPNVILEAMARGIPIVASNGGGIPDIVKPDETGFLVPPADSKALAYYIKLVAGDPGLRARLAGNCLAEMRAYRWPVVVAAVDRELARIAPGAVTAGSTRRSPG
jgi:glycosyltransferase involved in cell wall biosynthesis